MTQIKLLSSIAFGSCNHQNSPQPLWDVISKRNPQLYLWTGDTVYADKHSKPGSVDQVRDAYAVQAANVDYQRFLGTGIEITGVYDDHDYGVNDAGSELDFKAERAQAFLDFIGAPADDERRSRLALYSSQVYGTGPRQVKVIFLDTRTHRDPYALLNVGGLYAGLQSASRFVEGVFCIGRDHPGDMLGEEQWQWLERELTNSNAAINIIVSTVQVLTSAAIQESWGHMPHAQRRLLRLLNKTAPRGAMIISGDIHLAELLAGISTDPDGRREIMEVTSSGLTHSCGGKYGEVLCGMFARTWPRHRPFKDAYYMFENFGSVEIDWGRGASGAKDCKMCDGVCEATAKFTVHNAAGVEVLTASKSSCQRWSLDENTIVPVIPADGCTQNYLKFGLYSAVLMFIALYTLKRCLGIGRRSKNPFKTE